MSVLGDILEVGAMFDWITPLHAFGMDLYYALFRGGSHTFLIADECGWSGHGIIKLLRKSGIKTWGHMIVSHTIMITVPKVQAALAENILTGAGLEPWIESAPAPRPPRQPQPYAPPLSSVGQAPDVVTLQMQCPYCGNILPNATAQCPGCGCRQLVPVFAAPVEATAQVPVRESGWDQVERAGDRFFATLNRLGL